jgi:GntR family transcriptional regulator/MocR family aminotransferase
MMRHVPTNNQQSAASFIAHGHHEAFMRRLNIAYRHRAAALYSALQTYTPQLSQVPAEGGSALWVSGPPGLDTRKLAQRLYARGVVVEPGDVFFAGNEQPQNHLRIGYSSIAIDRIEPGVKIIAEELMLNP